MSQFWISDRSSTLRSSKTVGSASYFTRARGGYIIRISPAAMSRFVSPHDAVLISAGTPSKTTPSNVPAAMAAKIHKVR